MTSSAVTGGTDGLYTEAYGFETGTGNLKSKNGATYTYDATRKHAVTSLTNGNTYAYDDNGNMTDRYIASGPDAGTYEFEYDAENRMVGAKKNTVQIGQFFYDADGKQVKTIVNGISAFYVGNHYEVKNSVVTKYYFAGTTRLAVRTNGTLKYLLADHLGSTTLSTDANGTVSASALYKAFGELRYKPWGETRFSFGTMPTKYTFTGQFSYTDDPSTEESEGFGLMYYNARWVDVELARFTQPDSLVPDEKDTQHWDRFAYVRNNPVINADPTGHQDCMSPDCEGEGGATYGGAGDDASIATMGVNSSAMTSMVMLGELRYLQTLQQDLAGFLSGVMERSPYLTTVTCLGGNCASGLPESRTIAGIPQADFTIDNIPNLGTEGVQPNIRVIGGATPGDPNAAFSQFSGGATPEATPSGTLKANLPGGGTISLYTSSRQSGNVPTLFINSPLLKSFGFDFWKISFPF